jgi:hypothetical protein
MGKKRPIHLGRRWKPTVEHWAGQKAGHWVEWTVLQRVEKLVVHWVVERVDSKDLLSVGKSVVLRGLLWAVEWVAETVDWSVGHWVVEWVEKWGSQS